MPFFPLGTVPLGEGCHVFRITPTRILVSIGPEKSRCGCVLRVPAFLGRWLEEVHGQDISGWPSAPFRPTRAGARGGVSSSGSARMPEKGARCATVDGGLLIDRR